MVKSDLRNGNVIVTRDGRNRLVTDNGTCYNLAKGTVACLLSEYNDDLTSKVKECFDIVKVYSSVAMDNVLYDRATKVFKLDNLQKGWTFDTKKGNSFIVGKNKTYGKTATNLVTGYVWNLMASFNNDDIVAVYDADGDVIFKA